MTIKHLALLARIDPNDIRGWSGVPYHMMAELRKHFQKVTGFHPPKLLAFPLRRRINKIRAQFTGRHYRIGVNPIDLRFRAAIVSKKIRAANPDAVFTVTVDDICAYLRVKMPIIHHSDTTFAAMQGYYKDFTNLSHMGAAIHAKCAYKSIQMAALNIFPSQWAARSAIENYHADPARVHVVPYGANIEPPTSKKKIFDARSEEICRLLMIGGDWERKGGDMVIKVLDELDNRGIPCELNVIGKCPVSHELVNPIGFLDKSNPTDYSRYNAHWAQANFFILPTQAETFGAVFAEAAAWCVPVISVLTGGVPEAVVNHETGVLLPTDASAESFADAIQDLWHDKNKYKSMALNARKRYETVLNWPAWGRHVSELICKHIG